jgi:hypothetical protein
MHLVAAPQRLASGHPRHVNIETKECVGVHEPGKLFMVARVGLYFYVQSKLSACALHAQTVTEAHAPESMRLFGVTCNHRGNQSLKQEKEQIN